MSIDTDVPDHGRPAQVRASLSELKTSSGGFPGEQFRKAPSLAKEYGLAGFRTVAGTPSEMLDALSVGRRSWN